MLVATSFFICPVPYLVLSGLRHALSQSCFLRLFSFRIAHRIVEKRQGCVAEFKYFLQLGAVHRSPRYGYESVAGTEQTDVLRHIAGVHCGCHACTFVLCVAEFRQFGNKNERNRELIDEVLT